MAYATRIWSRAHRLVVFSVLYVLLTSTSVLAQVRPELFVAPGSLPVRLPYSAQTLVDFETQSNPVATRSNQPFWIEHLEIPLRFLGEDIGLGLDTRIRNSMVFMKNGEQYVRWILNPEDTQYGNEISAELRARGLDAAKKRHFIGYLTSSRSCIVQDPNSGVAFSIKSSTNQTAGSWKNKKETIKAAKGGRLMSDYLESEFSEAENQTLRLIKEPLAFSFQDVDQAIIVRQYDHFNDLRQNRLLVPVFSIAHERKGLEIARANGANNVPVYWAEHLMRRLGEALSELMFNFGIAYNSPHGQNFLVEVDRNMSPTGLIYARDYADSHLQKSIMAARGGQRIIDLYQSFTQNSKFEGGRLWLAVHPYFSGAEIKPSWLPSADLWKTQFIYAVKSRANALLELAEPSRRLRADIPLEASAGWGPDYWLWEGTLPDADVRALTQSLRARVNQQPPRAAYMAPPPVAAPAPPPVAPQVPVAPPQPQVNAPVSSAPPFRSWGEFIDAFSRSASLDGFAGRMAILADESSQYDLKAMKEAATTIGNVTLSSIERKLSLCTNPNAVYEILNALQQVHPLFIDYLGNADAILRNRQSTLDQYQKIENHRRSARDLNVWIEQVRTGTVASANTYADEIRARVRRPYQAVADALAFRLKREQNLVLRSNLAITLAFIGQGDEVVNDFLTKNSWLVPDDAAARVRDLLNRPRPIHRSCSGILR